MSSNQQPMSFWDLLNSLDPNRAAPGQGVDHSNTNNGPPFGGFFPFAAGPGGPGPHHRGPHPPPPPGAWPFGGDAGGDFDDWNPWAHHRGGSWGGRRGGRRGEARRERQEANTESETTRAEGTSAPDPDEVTPEDNEEHRPRCPPRGPRHGRGGPGHHGPGRRGPHGPGHHHGPPPGFDLGALINAFSDHPLVQNLREQFPQPGANNTTDHNATRSNASTPNTESSETLDRDTTTNNDVETFTPPLDLFSSPTSYTLHLALPGAKKEDVGVNWDPETSALHIAGVIHRPGDEAFLQTLVGGKGERTVGMFERRVELKGDEVDGMGIGARMEDGVLIVTVPKIEKGWTEIHKVEIE